MRALSFQAGWTVAVVFILLSTARGEVACENADHQLESVSCYQQTPESACTQSCCTDSFCTNSSCTPYGKCERCLANTCCGPLWTLTADAIFLHRSTPGSTVLIENTASPTERLAATDFDFGVHAGVDFTLTRRLSKSKAIEARYFGVDQWSEEEEIPTTPGDLLRLNSAVPFFVSAGTGIRTRYASDLNNAEINGLHQVNDWWTLLAGFRYLELDEHLRATLIDPPTAFGYRTNTRNRLYGFQLGSRVKLWESCGSCRCCGCCDCGRLSIDGVGKLGLYGNKPARLGVIDCFCPRVGGTATVPSTSSSSPRAAFVGELDFAATYRLRHRLAIRAGYRMLWLDGVALASDQTAVTAFLPPSLAPRPTIHTSGDVFYHGAFVGLQYQW